MTDQDVAAQEPQGDLRASLQSLLQEDLSDQDLRSRLQSLVGTFQGTTAQPTTDDATDHPGYQ